MKRTKRQLRVPDYILCGDLHIRDDQPISRTDDFLSAQWSKLDQIKEMQVKYNCPVLCSGDLFHRWKPSPALLSETIKHLPDKFYTVYGNHDLPQHNLDLAYKCGIYTLKTAGKLGLLWGLHWGQEPKSLSEPSLVQTAPPKRNIFVWHVPVYQKKELWMKVIPGAAYSARRVIKKIQKRFNVDLILTGDNHVAFTEEYNGTLLVNPGCLTRQRASEENYIPSVWFYYSDTNSVKRVPLKYEKYVITREHLEEVKERDDRLAAFISKLDGNQEISANFETNLHNFLSTNKVSKKIKDIIYQAIDDEEG